MSASGTPLISVEGVSKRFGGIQALSGVHLELRAGEVHALVGANGAGKSTLKNIIAGAIAPDEGHIRVDGVVHQLRRPLDALGLGIHAVHQELGLIPWMSVEDNLYLARYPTGMPGFLRRRAMRSNARRDLAALEVRVSPKAKVSTLSVGHQQLVEIARATAAEPRCLLLDEPSAVLVGPELERVLATVERLRSEGVAIVYVSHRLEEVFRLSDRVTVLRNGRVVESAPTAHFTRNSLIAAMTGRAVERPSVSLPRKSDSTRLGVRDVSAGGGRLRGVSLDVGAGEILGIAGLMGSGRSHLVKCIFGIDAMDAGTVTVDGQDLRARHPSSALERGVVLVPEDRKGAGLVIGMSIEQNLTLTNGKAISRGGWINASAARAVGARLAGLVGIPGARLRDPVSQLSGGNQQKVALARWLNEDPAVFIVDEPTRGVDVGAKEDIYRLIREVAGRGSAVLVVSSEFEELLALCHRVLVMRDGAIVGEVDPRNSSAEEMLRLCSWDEESVDVP
jgi:ABC-type sugar transport system ATPase subunit